MSLPTVSEEERTYYDWQEFPASHAHRRLVATGGSVTPVVKPTVSHENVTPVVKPTVSHEKVKDELEFHNIAGTCPICSCVTTQCGGSTRGPVPLKEGGEFGPAGAEFTFTSIRLALQTLHSHGLRPDMAELRSSTRAPLKKKRSLARQSTVDPGGRP